MRRLFLLAICLSYAAFADVPMWQRNNGAWEAVVRVSKADAFVDVGDFKGVTNGLVTVHYPHREETNVQWRVDYDYYSKHSGNSIVQERYMYSFYFYGYERVYPPPAPMSWTNDANTVTWKTNHFAEHCISDNNNVRYVYTAFTPVRTNVVDVTRPPIVVADNLPCRFGVPATVTVDLPYTDLLDLLPLDWPDTFIRVRTGFDGYILLRFTEDEMRLTIKRLLPERLPYEQTPKNIRVRLDDVLNGV